MKRLLALFFLLIGMGLAFSIGQFTYTPAHAEEGKCCAFSTQCSGTEVCKSPDGWLPCCNVNGSGCAGAGYCLPPLGD